MSQSACELGREVTCARQWFPAEAVAQREAEGDHGDGRGSLLTGGKDPGARSG